MVDQVLDTLLTAQSAPIFDLLRSNHKNTFSTAQSAPDFNLHWDPTIKNFFDLTSTIDQLFVKLIHKKIYTEKNENVPYELQWLKGEEDTIFTRLHMEKSKRNIDMFLY